jgi:hypothetical protein
MFFDNYKIILDKFIKLIYLVLSRIIYLFYTFD